MKDRAASRFAWILWGVSLAGAGAFIALELIRGQAPPSTVRDAWFNAQEALGAVVFPTVGVILASRRRDNPLGWLFLAIGLSFSMSAVGGALKTTSPFRSTSWQWGAWLETWTWVVGWFSMVTFLVLLFPDGHLPSPRWRWVGWAAGAGIVLDGVVGMFDPTAGSTAGYRSPLPTLPLASWNLDLLGTVLGAIAAVASIVALVRRFRRSSGDEHQQMKWFVYGAVATLIMIPGRIPARIPLLLVIGLVSIPLLPIATGIAILKYRLYDIDVVINKTLVYGALAGFITAVYVAIVVGLGAMIGAGTSEPNLGLSILATAVVAVAFQPVRDRVQKLANRLVYGKRASPYEVLSEFSHRMGGSYATEDVLPRMARILAEGTGASGTAVWLRVQDALRAAATWPDGADEGPPIPFDGDELPELPDVSATYPIRHRGELLGALSLTKAAGDRLRPAEEHLARDLAAGAGLVIRNVRLTQELMLRLDDLQASRQRIVAAADDARRKLERNIHDGAQQQLVALSVKARMAERMMGTDTAKSEEFLAQIEAELADALHDLRDLARGVYPPLLADEGLVAAVRAQARKAALRVEVEADGVGRYPQEVEAAAYFCILEALQNVAKYAGASRVVVRLSHEPGSLEFTVTDDGVGFDPKAKGYGTGMEGMADRLSALGGELRIESSPGAGTIVAGRIPAPVLEAVS